MSEVIEEIYKFDYVRGLMFIYNIHTYTDNNDEWREYIKDVNISDLTYQELREIWESGKASAFKNSENIK